MPTLPLYVVVVLVWGSSWIMIRYQNGPVPAEFSVAYRFLIAAAMMFAWVMIRRLPLRFSARDHLFIALQGALIFSTNFFLFYLASPYLTTGLIAVVFSTSSACIMLIGAVFLRRRPPVLVITGALLGMLGICAVFWPELEGLDFSSDAGRGLVLSIGGTLCFSLGSIVAGRNQSAGLSVRGSTAWAMLYGTFLLMGVAFLRGSELTFDTSPAYVGSLVFLAVFASVIAFACYFALIARIGAERAAYATVLFPIVALSISTVFEGYAWSALSLAGVVLTLAGNVLVLRGRPATENAGRHDGQRLPGG